MAQQSGSLLCRTAAFLAGLVVIVVMSPNGWAINFGPSAGNLYYTDDYYQLHTYRSLTQTMTNSANYVRANETSNTDMTLGYVSTFSLSEVAHYDYAYGADFPIASAGCFAGEVDGDICHRHRIRYNTDKVFNCDTDHVACHEMGHAVALGHRSINDGCMAKDWRHWSAHARSHVNIRY